MVSGENSLPGLQVATGPVSHHTAEGERREMFLFLKATSAIELGPHVMF